MARIQLTVIKVMSAVLLTLFTQFVQASGLIKPKSAQYNDLTIQSHLVDVVIEDTYATTTIVQEFFNPNDVDLETIYSFPVPKDAIVGEFIYWINGQPVIAEAVKKEQAEKIYQEQKAQGNSVATAAKDSFKTFDITVYPVPAKQSVKIQLVYMQNITLDHGVGRYVYPMEEGGVDEQKEAFWSRNNVVESQFEFNVTMRSSYPVDAIRLPKHPQATITQTNADTWQALISSQNSENESQSFRLDQDIVVYWRHVEGLPGRVDMVAYRDSEQSNKGTVKLTFTPGDDLTAIHQERDWVFVLDRSGSMTGKYATLVEGVRQGLSRLPAEDRFKVIAFDDFPTELTSGYLNVNENNVNKVLNEVETLGVGGGTNLYAGLSKALSGLDSDRPTGLILVTDGVANVGVTEKKGFLKLLSKYDVRLFTFVMGNSANEPLLNSMTQISNGFAQNVSNSDDIQGQLLQATSKINHEAYRNIKLDIDGVKIKNLTPQEISSLYRGEQLSLFGHYFKAGKVNVTLTAKKGAETKKYTTEITLPQQDTRNPELERLWAFSAIQDMQKKQDYLGVQDGDIEQAITDIALEYGLLTDYTSLLVVEDEVFKTLNIERSNKARVEREQKARKHRQQKPVKESRADKKKPMFELPSPSLGSGGSLSYMGLFLIGGLLLMRHRRPFPPLKKTL